MADRFDPRTMDTAALTLALRGWLRQRSEQREVLAAALAYELAALIAREYPSEAAALELLDEWVATMKEQILVLGAGVEHP